MKGSKGKENQAQTTPRC